jgi:hypothetical protein
MSSTANASSSGGGSISKLTPTSGGAFIFYQTGTRTTRPACSTQDRWAIDVSTNSGQALVAALLTAYSMGKQIAITGTGTCTVWEDTETVYNFETGG